MFAIRPDALTPEPRAVGERIKQRRKELGLTQGELAHRLGLSQATVSAYEKGLTQIPPYHLERLADQLGVEQRYLHGEGEPRAALPEFLMDVHGEDLIINVSIRLGRRIDDARTTRILKHLRRLLNEARDLPSSELPTH